MQRWTRRTNAAWQRAIVPAAAVAMLWPSAAAAQFGPQPVAFENARIIMPDGRIIENGVIIVRGDRIASVRESGIGEDAGRGRMERIDLGGGTVTAGLIDVTDVVANTASGGNQASLRAADAFDGYAVDAIQEALANGITAGFIAARGGPGVNGVGSVVRFTPNDGGSYGGIVLEDAALCVNMGSQLSPLQRIATFDSIRKTFQGALDYREAFLTYEEELEEYEKKLKERAAKKEGEGGEEQKPQPKPGEEGDGEGEGEQDQGGDGDGEGDGDGGGEGDGSLQVPPRPRPRPGGGPPGRGGAGQQRGGGQQGDDELKKPTEPQYNVANETLLRAIDNELRVRFLAHNSEDILNTLDLAREFGLKVIVEGARESGPVAEALAEAEVPVVLDYESNGAADGRDLERTLDQNIRALDDAGVRWSFGSGRGMGDASRFLLLHAQIAAQTAGDSPVSLLTRNAAEALGAEDLGRLEEGAYADFVIWSGDPAAPTSLVQAVYVGGEQVYPASTETETDAQENGGS